MSDENNATRSLVPHAAIAGIILLVIALVFFWPNEEESPEPKAIEVPEAVQATQVETPATQQTTMQAQPEPVEPEPMPEPEIEAPEPEPLDISDGAVKAAVMAVSNFELIGHLIVNDALVQRFVVLVSNLAEEELAFNHQVLTPPQKAFRTYQQAEREWIDAASYKRYTPYVDALDSIETYDLLHLYRTYKPSFTEFYAEIGDPDQDFNKVMSEAINHLLDTPEMPVPVEVYTDSVMYKFKNERLESLSHAQKQLLRTGPDNMRRIKAKLRELQQLL